MNISPNQRSRTCKLVGLYVFIFISLTFYPDPISDTHSATLSLVALWFLIFTLILIHLKLLFVCGISGEPISFFNMANYFFKNHWPCFHTFVSRFCWTLFCCITLSISVIHNVTESRVQLLAAQKPIKRPGWWKGKFVLFWMPATSSLVWCVCVWGRGTGVRRRGMVRGGDGAGKADACAKTDSLHWQWARAFTDGGSNMQKQHSRLGQWSWDQSLVVWSESLGLF